MFFYCRLAGRFVPAVQPSEDCVLTRTHKKVIIGIACGLGCGTLLSVVLTPAIVLLSR
jgi:hypothetical protein